MSSAAMLTVARALPLGASSSSKTSLRFLKYQPSESSSFPPSSLLLPPSSFPPPPSSFLPPRSSQHSGSKTQVQVSLSLSIQACGCRIICQHIVTLILCTNFLLPPSSGFLLYDPGHACHSYICKGMCIYVFVILVNSINPIL